MTRGGPLDELDQELDRFEYSVERHTVLERDRDVVLRYTEGTELLPDVLGRIGTDRSDSRGELSSEVFDVLPVEAVGEPGQSEGEG